MKRPVFICVTEAELETKKTIPTAFGPVLSWEYWCYVKHHPILKWDSATNILYGSEDEPNKPGNCRCFPGAFS